MRVEQGDSAQPERFFTTAESVSNNAVSSCVRFPSNRAYVNQLLIFLSTSTGAFLGGPKTLNHQVG